MGKRILSKKYLIVKTSLRFKISILNMIPNTDIELEKVSYRISTLMLRFEISILNTIQMTDTWEKASYQKS